MKKNSLNSPIKNIYNKNVIYIDHKQNLSLKVIKNIFNRNKINIIPIINSSKKIIKILNLNQFRKIKTQKKK